MRLFQCLHFLLSTDSCCDNGNPFKECACFQYVFITVVDLEFSWVGEAPTPKVGVLTYFWSKTAWKLKNLDPGAPTMVRHCIIWMDFLLQNKHTTLLSRNLVHRLLSQKLLKILHRLVLRCHIYTCNQYLIQLIVCSVQFHTACFCLALCQWWRAEKTDRMGCDPFCPFFINTILTVETKTTGR